MDSQRGPDTHSHLIPKEFLARLSGSELTCVASDEALQVSVGVARRDVVAAIVQPMDLVVFHMTPSLRLPVLPGDGWVGAGKCLSRTDG